MARSLRIERPGAWYHVTSRGTERRRIFMDDRDRWHWLELVGRAVEMWRLVVHAYVEMDNHYHLLVETPDANLGRAMQWLNVGYTIWFNRRHGRVGPLFQGRYKAVLVDRLGWGFGLSRYIHLNPVRVARLGLDKASRQADRLGATPGHPQARLVQERLQRLREYPWSSYRAYAGLAEGLAWLETRSVLELGGRGTQREQQRDYQKDVEAAVRDGLPPSPWAELKGQIFLGSEEAWEALRRKVRGREREQPQARKLRRRPSMAEITKVVEGVKGMRWADFRDRHGDWGRDLVLALGRWRSGLTLRELGEWAGGMDYAAVGAAVKRLERRAASDATLAGLVRQAEAQLLKIET